jgi:hypothetical protein
VYAIKVVVGDVVAFDGDTVGTPEVYAIPIICDVVACDAVAIGIFDVDTIIEVVWVIPIICDVVACDAIVAGKFKPDAIINVI